MRIRITYDESEIESLDDDIKSQLDGGEIDIEPTPENAQKFLNIAGAEDVQGLRSALAEERSARKKYERDFKSVKAKLTLADDGEKDAEIAQLKSQLEERTTEIESLKTEAVEKDRAAKITSAVSKHRGDVELLMPHLKSTLAENPDADLDEVLTDFKEKHPSAFAASSQSGGGSLGDGGAGGSGSRFGSRLSLPKRRSEMSEREKVEAQKSMGLDAYLELPE